MSDILLELKDLKVSVRKDKSYLPIVKGVDIAVPKGEIVGLVGESGCGKSMSAKSIMGLLPSSARVEGSIFWHGKDGTTDLTGLKEKELRKMCGPEISMIFQEPMTSLNPMMRIGDQVAEVLLVHKLVKNRNEAREKVIRLLSEVGISEPELRYRSYPHEFSGGMRQRVMIAMAMICEPKLLIADEPTTALDVTIEAQILKLIRQMCTSHNMSAIIITHNMRVVSQLCDSVYVMYMGRIMERSSVRELFENPLHPYTKGLLSSIPKIGDNPEYLSTIPGNIPEAGKEAVGCEFCLRCSDDERKCFFERPGETKISEDHFVSCFCVEREGRIS
ncbi:MAG: ABC transporter ATP-binding protein [Lachnospiraceae bacterium]|nr:ABC transporter ATP-binding protein [Lachnospiraceae bacterium]